MAHIVIDAHSLTLTHTHTHTNTHTYHAWKKEEKYRYQTRKHSTVMSPQQIHSFTPQYTHSHTQILSERRRKNSDSHTHTDTREKSVHNKWLPSRWTDEVSVIHTHTHLLRVHRSWSLLWDGCGVDLSRWFTLHHEWWLAHHEGVRTHIEKDWVIWHWNTPK